MRLLSQKRTKFLLMLTGLVMPIVGIQPMTVWAKEAWTTYDEISKRSVNLKSQDSTADQALMELAKAADINVLFDATQSEATKPFSYTADGTVENGSLLTATVRIAHEGHLGWKRVGATTYLFWPEPDLTILARGLAKKLREERDDNFGLYPPRPRKTMRAENGQMVPVPETPAEENEKAIPQSQLPTPQRLQNWTSFAMRQEHTLQLMMATYLHDVKGWDGRAADFKAQFSFSDLPTEVQAYFRSLISSRTPEQTLMGEPWLHDEVWPQARVHVFDGGGAPGLALSAVINGERVMQPVDWLDKRPRVPTAAPPDAVKTSALPFQWKTHWAVHAETSPALAAASHSVAVAPLLTSSALEADAALKAPVSVEVSRQELPKLLAELQKQGGVKLQIAAVTSEPQSTLRQRKVTARLQKMPLSDAMGALSNLLGAAWRKTAKGEYELIERLETGTQRDFRRVGDTEWFYFWREPARRVNAPKSITLEDAPSWSESLLKETKMEALRSPDGVAFKALSPTLQTRLQRAVRQSIGLDLLRAASQSAFLDEEISLHTAPFIINNQPPQLSLLITGANEQPLWNMTLDVDAIWRRTGQDPLHRDLDLAAEAEANRQAGAIAP